MSLKPDTESLSTPGLATTTTAVLALSGMHCASCVALIEETLTESPGVTDAVVNLTTATAHVTFDPFATAVEDLCAAIAREGYGAAPQGEPES
jgi:P-type Cu+ transporter